MGHFEVFSLSSGPPTWEACPCITTRSTSGVIGFKCVDLGRNNIAWDCARSSRGGVNHRGLILVFDFIAVVDQDCGSRGLISVLLCIRNKFFNFRDSIS